MLTIDANFKRSTTVAHHTAQVPADSDQPDTVSAETRLDPGVDTATCTLLQSGALLAASRQWKTSQEARDEVARWDKLNVETAYTIAVPLTQMRIDTNDFGLVGGLVHFVILIWLMLSLRREASIQNVLKAAQLHAVASWQNFFASINFSVEPDPNPSRASAGVQWLLVGLGLLVLYVGIGLCLLLHYAPTSLTFYPRHGFAGATALWVAGPFFLLASRPRFPTLMAVATPVAVWGIGLFLDIADWSNLAGLYDQTLLVLVRDGLLWFVNLWIALMISAAFFGPELLDAPSDDKKSKTGTDTQPSAPPEVVASAAGQDN